MHSTYVRKYDVQKAVEMLNLLKGTPAGDRIGELLRLSMSAIEASQNTTYSDFLQGSARCDELRRIEREVNALLERYVAVRWILCGREGSARIAPWVPYPEGRSDEFETVVLIMDLFESDSLSLIRNCECGAYFFARSSLSRFCSKGCRERFWENSEARKEQKRKNAREYYRLHKSTNVR